MTQPAVPRVDFYFDVVCPYAYLAHTQVGPLCARLGVALRYRPILLGGLFRVVGSGAGPMPSMPAAKAKLNLLDMYRWADHLGVALNMPAAHPQRTVLAMRTIIASDDVPRAAHALYQSYWGRGEDVSDPALVGRVLTRAGFDGADLVAQAQRPAMKQRLRAAVDEAAAQGAFGVPTMVVHTAAGSEMFWGQDRLAFVERLLTRAA
ncbi:MAG TPA: 2-hydroxychromene-2-carboxylate isomerase [Sorangium sp.]|nr:2-hydroxychromene-2-carboxylate isomerase [Sorangium sp.]